MPLLKKKVCESVLFNVLEDLKRILQSIDIESDDESVDDSGLELKLGRELSLDSASDEQPTSTMSMSAMLQELKNSKAKIESVEEESPKKDNQETEEENKGDEKRIETEARPFEEAVESVEAKQEEMQSDEKENFENEESPKEKEKEESDPEEQEKEIKVEADKGTESPVQEETEIHESKEKPESTGQLNVEQTEKPDQPEQAEAETEAEKPDQSEQTLAETQSQPLNETPSPEPSIPAGGSGSLPNSQVVTLEDLFPTPTSLSRFSEEIPDDFNTRQFLLSQQISQAHPGFPGFPV